MLSLTARPFTEFSKTKIPNNTEYAIHHIRLFPTLLITKRLFMRPVDHCSRPSRPRLQGSSSFSRAVLKPVAKQLLVMFSTHSITACQEKTYQSHPECAEKPFVFSEFCRA